MMAVFTARRAERAPAPERDVEPALAPTSQHEVRRAAYMLFFSTLMDQRIGALARHLQTKITI